VPIRESFGAIGAKLLGKDSEHISRFHSRRGELCKPLELLSVPGLLVQRLAGKAHNRPWMAPAAVSHLQDVLSPDDVLLELGAGSSTSWYATRVRRVVSLEPYPEWAERVRCDLRHFANAELRVGSIKDLFVPALRELRPSVLIVDFDDEPEISRPDAIRIALDEGAAPRIIVLDDSDRAGYSAAAGILKNWTAMRFTGFRNRPLRLTETILFVLK